MHKIAHRGKTHKRSQNWGIWGL